MNIQQNKSETKRNQTYEIKGLTDKQWEEFRKLIDEYKDIFTKDKNELGRTNIIKHSIDTGDEKPVKQGAYRMSQKEKEINKEEITKMLQKGVIRKSRSSWSS